MYGLSTDWELEPPVRRFELEDYTGATRGGAPDAATTVCRRAPASRTRRATAPEKTVVVSGIGCSSRFPHYMKTYGFHGLHGRPLPVACGVRSAPPDLHLFVVTGDGDCCAIGTRTGSTRCATTWT